jgi:hypothetical protein
VAVAGEGSETGGDHRGLLDRCVVALLEVAQQPTRRDPRMPALILPRDEHGQLKRIREVKRWKFLRRGLGDDQVPTVEGSAKDCERVPGRSRRCSSPGPDGVSSLDRTVASKLPHDLLAEIESLPVEE